MSKQYLLLIGLTCIAGVALLSWLDSNDVANEDLIC